MDVQIKTSDGIAISGTYIPGSSSLGIVLIHMLPQTRQSFDDLAGALNEHGWHTFAIDLRGHGQSEGLDYKTFTDEQHQQYILDVTGAVDWLKAKVSAVGLIGASIGANLAIQYAAANQSAFVVALSAGVDYHGVRAIDAVGKVTCPILFLASKGDQHSSGMADEMANQLCDKSESNQKSIRIYDSGGHGTDLLKEDFSMQKFLINWILQIID